MQFKTTARYHLEAVQLASMKQTSVGDSEEKGEPWCLVGGNANWCSSYEKQYGAPQKITNEVTV